MGNRNCKQCSMSVFQDEEEEENWFEWMEATEEERNGKHLAVSPKTELLAVQPQVFRVDMSTDPFKSTTGNFDSDRKNLKGLKSSLSDDSVFTSEIADYRENNNVAKRTSLNLDDESAIVQDSQNFPSGELNISLCFDEATRRLKVHIVKARNLCCRAGEGKKHDKCAISCSDLYVKVSLLNGQQLLKSQRTTKKKGSSEVLFYETFAFDLSNVDYIRSDLVMRLTAMHCYKNIINLDHVIGHVDTRTDSDSGSNSLAVHWFVVITCSGKTINRWHTLWS